MYWHVINIGLTVKTIIRSSMLGFKIQALMSLSTFKEKAADNIVPKKI